MVRDLAGSAALFHVELPVLDDEPDDDIEQTIKRLRSSAHEAEAAMEAIAHGLEERAKALENAEAELAGLQEREKSMRDRVQALESVAPPAVRAMIRTCGWFSGWWRWRACLPEEDLVGDSF